MAQWVKDSEFCCGLGHCGGMRSISTLGSSRTRKRKKGGGVSSCHGSVENNLTVYENIGLITGLTQWVKDPVLP